MEVSTLQAILDSNKNKCLRITFVNGEKVSLVRPDNEVINRQLIAKRDENNKVLFQEQDDFVKIENGCLKIKTNGRIHTKMIKTEIVSWFDYYDIDKILSVSVIDTDMSEKYQEMLKNNWDNNF